MYRTAVLFFLNFKRRNSKVKIILTFFGVLFSVVYFDQHLGVARFILFCICFFIKSKKRKNIWKNDQQKLFWGCLNPKAGPGFNSEEVFSGNKTLDQHSGVNPKNTFLGVQSYHLISKNPISTNPYINYSLHLT